MTVKFYETQREDWRTFGKAEAVKKLFAADVLPYDIEDIMSAPKWRKKLRKQDGEAEAVRELKYGVKLDAAFDAVCNLYGWDAEDKELYTIWSAAVDAVAEKEVRRIAKEAE